MDGSVRVTARPTTATKGLSRAAVGRFRFQPLQSISVKPSIRLPHQFRVREVPWQTPPEERRRRLHPCSAWTFCSVWRGAFGTPSPWTRLRHARGACGQGLVEVVPSLAVSFEKVSPRDHACMAMMPRSEPDPSGGPLSTAPVPWSPRWSPPGRTDVGIWTLEVPLCAVPRELYEANARAHATFASWAVSRDLKPFSAGDLAPVSQCQFAILERSLCCLQAQAEGIWRKHSSPAVSVATHGNQRNPAYRLPSTSTSFCVVIANKPQASAS